MPEPGEHGIDRVSAPRPTSHATTGEHDARPRRRTPSTRPRRRGGRSGTGPRGRSRRGTRAATSAPNARQPAAHARGATDRSARGRERQEQADGEDDARRDPRLSRRGRGCPRWRSRGSSLAVGERCARRRASPSPAPASRRARRARSRSRTVGATSMMFDVPGAIAWSATPASPCRTRVRAPTATRERTSGSRRRGADDDHRVASGSTCSSSWPTSRSVSSQRAVRATSRLLARTRTGPRRRRARGRSPRRAPPCPVAPRVVERRDHAVVVEPHAERRGRIVLEQRAIDLALRDLARARHQRARPRRGGTTGRAAPACSGSLPSPLAMTARATPGALAARRRAAPTSAP